MNEYLKIINQIIKLRQSRDKIEKMIPPHTMKAEINFEVEEREKQLTQKANELLCSQCS